MSAAHGGTEGAMDALRELAARRTSHEQHMDWVLATNPQSYRQEMDSEWISTSPGSPGYEDAEDKAILRAREELERREAHAGTEGA